MAKKDTINALVRRGLDRDSAEKLADNGFLLNDVQTASKEELMEVLSDEEANEVIEELQEEDEDGEEEGQYGGKDWESSYESEEELFSEKDESVNAGGDVGERLDNEEIKKWEEKFSEKRAFLYIMLVFFFSLFIGFGLFDPLPAFLIAFFGSGTFWSYIVFYKKPKLRKEYLDNPKHQSHIDFHTLKKMFSYEDFDEDAQERMVEKKIKRLIEEEKLQGEYNEITRTYKPPSVMGQGKNYDEKKDSVTTGIKKSKKKEKGIVGKYKGLSEEKQTVVELVGVIFIVIILVLSVYTLVPSTEEEEDEPYFEEGSDGEKLLGTWIATGRESGTSGEKLVFSEPPDNGQTCEDNHPDGFFSGTTGTFYFCWIIYENINEYQICVEYDHNWVYTFQYEFRDGGDILVTEDEEGYVTIYEKDE